MDFDRPIIRKIYNLLLPKLNLGTFYKISSGDSSSAYIFRGMIVYYGRHYWAYFYSQKFDSWFQFDDAKITKIGNWCDVCDKCERAKAIPRTIFYEKQELLVSMLLDGDRIRNESDMLKIYCSDSQMQMNNFWKCRASGKDTKGCTLF